MSSGLPVLGLSNCSGVNELIDHSLNGFLAVDNDELAVYLERLIQNSELRSVMGKSGHIKMKNFTPESVIACWTLFLGQMTN